MSLKNQAASAVKWSSVSQIARQAMQFITAAILAHLLSPSDFGLLGMATLVTGFITLFQDLGTSAAIIQRKDISDKLLSSIFWINVAFGLLGTVILYLVSPLVANFYHEPKLSEILQVLSLNFFLSGVSILHKSLLQRDLSFNTLAKIEIVAIIFGSIVGIGSALLGAGVWSLVYQTLAIVILTTVLLWVSTSWKPKIIFDWSEVKQISSYSLNLAGVNIFNYFIRNADYLLIGKFLGSKELGYYTLAYRLMLFPLQNISHVIARVMFPVFSQIQDDNAKFRLVYLKATSTIALITFPLMVGLWAVAEPFVLALFGSQWRPVIWLLMILAPVGMAQSVETTVGTIYQAKGRTDWMLRWEFAAGLWTVTAFVIGLRWGILGVATAYAISSFASVYPNFAIPFHLIQLRMRDFWAVLWRTLVASLLMLLVLLGLKFLLSPSLLSVWLLAVLVSTGGIVYLLTSWLINREQIQQLLAIVGIKN
jgi:PST family polysaccharide transporter